MEANMYYTFYSGFNAPEWYEENDLYDFLRWGINPTDLLFDDWI